MGLAQLRVDIAANPIVLKREVRRAAELVQLLVSRSLLSFRVTSCVLDEGRTFLGPGSRLSSCARRSC